MSCRREGGVLGRGEANCSAFGFRSRKCLERLAAALTAPSSGGGCGGGGISGYVFWVFGESGCG